MVIVIQDRKCQRDKKKIQTFKEKNTLRWVISEERWPASSLTKLRNGSDYQ